MSDGLPIADLCAGGRHPLGYCTNLHPAPDLATAETCFRDLVGPTLHDQLGEGPVALGAWWPADLVRELATEAGTVERHATLLAGLGLVPLSLNLFPMGRFHGGPVKEAVYEPDWASDARRDHTIAAARVQARLLARMGASHGSMSTLPLGFRGRDRAHVPSEAHARQLVLVATALARIAGETGVELVLALEPEPGCILETAFEALRWLADEAFAHAARQGQEPAARAHLGLCLDLCHAGVAGEDAVEVVDLCARSGVRLGKVQLTNALVARGPGGLAKLRAYDEPVYLHQVASSKDRAGPWLDLGELAGYTPLDDEELRCHFHVPLPFAGDAELGSTRAELCAFLAFVASGGLPAGVPLEVETYTRPEIEAELAFARRWLTGCQP